MNNNLRYYHHGPIKHPDDMRVNLFPSFSSFFGPPTDHDWPEDFKHENGNYICKCSICGVDFRGHKRRLICKKCCYKD